MKYESIIATALVIVFQVNKIAVRCVIRETQFETNNNNKKKIIIITTMYSVAATRQPTTKRASEIKSHSAQKHSE